MCACIECKAKQRPRNEVEISVPATSIYSYPRKRVLVFPSK